ncbi:MULTISPECIES: hypothetical protein [unclassified Paenibacillus]|uniref:hypothetical protein n=1 Tax=unclassified Paenibacillus TaxID=185978 RepID=UPI0030F63BA5
MQLQIVKVPGTNDTSYVTNKMIEFNLKHFPDELKGRYQAVNLLMKDSDGNVYGGLVSQRLDYRPPRKANVYSIGKSRLEIKGVAGSI